MKVGRLVHLDRSQDPAQRPSATALLQHPFIRDNRQELRSTWTRTIANRSRGGVSSDTHTRIDAVVQRILKVWLAVVHVDVCRCTVMWFD